MSPPRPHRNAPPAIRPAEVGDAESLAALAVRTFRQTFEAQNTPEDMEAHLRDSYSVPKTVEELSDPDNLFFLAFTDDPPKDSDPVGYAKLILGPPESCIRGPKPIELGRLYVDQSALGRGLGAALMRHCLAEAEARGFETLWLGVWEHNERAKRFYEKWGFEKVGAHPFQLGSDLQTDWLLERPVRMPRAGDDPG